MVIDLSLIHISSVRGNIQTRLQKLDAGAYDALVLAAAGLQRAGLSYRISRYFSIDEILPAAGQGILAVQGRRDCLPFDLSCIHHPASAAAAQAEREFVRALQGGCTSCLLYTSPKEKVYDWNPAALFPSNCHSNVFLPTAFLGCYIVVFRKKSLELQKSVFVEAIGTSFSFSSPMF